MCGIAGIFSLNGRPVSSLEQKLAVMDRLLAHRGPDGTGTWRDPQDRVGLLHRRLAIIDLSAAAAQPMVGSDGSVLVQNGEIYNYLELRTELKAHWPFATRSDSETILAAHSRYGDACLDHLRGMFAFALWDDRAKRLLCARDRFGIKPFYYCVVDDCFIWASEAKALLPFLAGVETDPVGLAEYLTFQYSLGEQTLFRGVRQLLPGHALAIEDGRVKTWRYWDVSYDVDSNREDDYFAAGLRSRLDESLALHLRSDVPVAAYLSGGLDSSLMAVLAAESQAEPLQGAFHGTFLEHQGYDESHYAKIAASAADCELDILEITAADFTREIDKVIYALDYPVAGPGSFPQYMVSKRAGERVKVILGGQGGDEIFGGYARYLVAYFEQCIKAAIEGTYGEGHFVVTAESIIPNLQSLRDYKPMIQGFWRDGLFGPLDERYFRLIDRSADMTDEIDWGELDKQAVFESYRAIFNSPANVGRHSYFDKMTHFDFKGLLPALLQVEDRVSMAHGLESRVPFLDHPLIEFVATVPATAKFRDGELKYLLKKAFGARLPKAIAERRDKMGFPVPLKEWFAGPLRPMIADTFSARRAKERPHVNAAAVLANFGSEARFSRKTWGLLSLELWQQQFHDRAPHFKTMLRDAEAGAPGLRAVQETS